MKSRKNMPRSRRIHFLIFDFISWLILVAILMLMIRLMCKSLDFEYGWERREYDERGNEIVSSEEKTTYKPVSASALKVTYHPAEFVELKEIESDSCAKTLVIEKEEEKIDSNYLGRFRITHYCDCERCQGQWVGTTATGVKPTAGKTIAVDPRVIPLGSKVVINGHTYTAQDTGGAIRGNRIDIFVSSHEEANRKGVYYTGVYRG